MEGEDSLCFYLLDTCTGILTRKTENMAKIIFQKRTGDDNFKIWAKSRDYIAAFAFFLKNLMELGEAVLIKSCSSFPGYFPVGGGDQGKLRLSMLSEIVVCRTVHSDSVT
ncbi:hypothetical protein QQP08_025364 [Theobroma cacao]|nr:hypothetical protein QQP08_025364 [Theobroma cacao]